MEYQQTIFDFLYEQKKINKKIRLIELFAGIGSQAKALKNIGADFETYKVVEFDKYAIASYNAIHNTNFLTQDITQISGNDLEIIDTKNYEYIMTYSFPCQDLSLAGKQKGMSKGTSTRSGLLWEVERLLNECKELPQILLMENVPMIHSKDNISDFNLWINFLESKGYKNYWQDLNAKNYGIPQNRNRTFMISILGDYNYVFPKKKKLKLRLKDMLEDEVDDSYYLSEKDILKIYNWNAYQKPLDRVLGNESISPTITARGAGEDHSGMILLSTVLENDTKILIPEATKQGYAVAGDGDGDGVYINRPHQKRGVVQKGLIQTIKTQPDDLGVVVKLKKNTNNYIEWEEEGKLDCDCRAWKENCVAPTTTTTPKTKVLLSDLRIRKLTPKECYRLMGFSDEDYEKASKVNSKAQLYKQAGNSIVVNVLEEIFKQLF